MEKTGLKQDKKLENLLGGGYTSLHYETAIKNWLGRQDSNLGMPESKSGALPLGDAPLNQPKYVRGT